MKVLVSKGLFFLDDLQVHPWVFQCHVFHDLFKVLFDLQVSPEEFQHFVLAD